MSTNELNLTLVGWVATGPKLYTGTNPFTSFRMASTRRYFDRTQNAWVDGRTEWFTVKCWRDQARNVAHSLRKSDPVLVTGRLGTEVWDGPEGPRTTLVLEALAIGPDLTFGSSNFARTVHPRDDQAAGEGDGSDGDAISSAGDDRSGDDAGPGYPVGGSTWDVADLAEDGGPGDGLDPDEAGVGALSAARSIT